jgi:putative nucleotidyltransferase with HDIG domain
MSTDILEDARLFLVNSLRGRQNEIESRHPWRRSWEFAILHTLRVEAYTTRILAMDQHSLSSEEITLLRLAAILHDIARLNNREEHAKLGAEIARRWLTESSSTPLPGNDVARVAEMIADHSNKASPESDYSKAVLKDADTLDEIGVMSIFMAANWVEMKSPFFFHELRQSMVDVEVPFCDRKLAILNTQGARQILQERKTFLESFIAQITDELQADAQIEQMLLALYRDDTKAITEGEKQDG